ncbi:MAG TPA: C4-dicarboxylate ABC transporter substrate-binding protein, partial [Pseudolysinimonas sp.]|nr:C4-dicarboxylate ABC transporter substrate-binding protein [Pseudolysinimonas sp.]
MKSSTLIHGRAKALALATIATSAALILASCAGSVGGSGDEYEGEGFAYGASQEEVNAVIEDLDPITITYQPAAASDQTLTSAAAKAFKEEVERRSNGQITVDVVYGQAIANFVEMYDALADGRLDVAWGLPAFAGQQFAASNDVGIASAQILPSSLLAGELVSMAVMDELGWQSEPLLKAFEDLGLTPLTPALYSGQVVANCVKPLVTEDDFAGRTIRVPSQGVFAAVSSLGATPVSLQFNEAFEALQRGTVGCNIGGYGGTAESGLT